MVVEGTGGDQAGTQPVSAVGQALVLRIPGRHDRVQQDRAAATSSILGEHEKTAVHGGNEKCIVIAAAAATGLWWLLFYPPDASTDVEAFHLGVQLSLVPESQLFVITPYKSK
jgi:hypothetical protein